MFYIRNFTFPLSRLYYSIFPRAYFQSTVENDFWAPTMSDRTGDGLKEVSGTGGSNDGPNDEPDGVHTMHRLLKKSLLVVPNVALYAFYIVLR